MAILRFGVPKRGGSALPRSRKGHMEGGSADASIHSHSAEDLKVVNNRGIIHNARCKYSLSFR